MWSYFQVNGVLNHNGSLVGVGYSGHPPHVNDPAAEGIENSGPIPKGRWAIGEAYDDPVEGPVVMALTPAPETITFNRSAFRIHGDEVEHPGAELASHGCIILSRMIRMMIALSIDKDLEVV
jgi:hypothetical protein